MDLERSILTTNFVAEERAGRFRVSWYAIRNEPEALSLLFSKMVVIHAEQDLRSQSVTYVAYSRLFDKTDPERAIPEYELTIHIEDGAPRLEVSRVGTEKTEKMRWVKVKRPKG